MMSSSALVTTIKFLQLNNCYSSHKNRWKELAKKGKEKQIPLRDDDKDKIEELSDKLKAAVKSKETAKSNEDKLLAATAIEDAKMAIKQVAQHIH